MRTKTKEIVDLLSPVVSSLGLELLGVDFVPSATRALLRLYIDAAGRAVNLEDCEAVSREVSAQLDVNDPITTQYVLEVSSPGIDRPLFSAEHFARRIGEVVKVHLQLPQDGRRRVQGTITEVIGEQITLDVDGLGAFVLLFNNVEKAKIVPNLEALGLVSSQKKPVPKPNIKSKK